MISDNIFQEKIKETPHKTQIDVINCFNENKSKEIVLCCGRRWGKSWIAGYLAAKTFSEGLSDIFEGKRESVKIWIVSPCVDIETEILSKRGWLKYNELKTGDEVLTLNNKGESEWQDCLSVQKFYKEGWMKKINNRGVDAFTTINHKWPVGYITSNAGNGRKKILGYRFVETSELKKSNEFILSSAEVINIPIKKTINDNLVSLVGWYWTEGSDNGGGINISQNRGKKADSIRNVLFNLFGAPQSYGNKIKGKKASWTDWKKQYKEDDKNNNGVFYLNRSASEILRRIAPDKVISYDFINKLTIDQLKLLLDVSVSADGHKRIRSTCGAEGTKYQERVIVQKKKERIDRLQMVAQLAGIPSTLKKRDIWVLNLLNRNKHWLGQKNQRKNIKDVYYRGIVWCPRTKNETWLARRNGDVYFTGNSYELSKKVFEYVVRFLRKIDKRIDQHISDRPFPQIKISESVWIQCKSADNPTSLLGEELDLLIIDEAANIPNRIWFDYLMPTTISRARNCRTIFISCVVKNTFVLTDKGLKRVSDFPFNGKKLEKQKYNGGVLFGKDGLNEIGYLWENPKQKTIKITTEGGYEIEGTPHHPIIARDTIYKKFGDWTELQRLTKNHFALLQLNQQVFGNNDVILNDFKPNNYCNKIKIPKIADKDFSYFIGLILGDGYVGKRDITITNKDNEIIDFLRNNPFCLFFSESKDGVHFRTGSDEFIRVLNLLGYKPVLAKYKTIPNKCLEWSKGNICSLLSGLFDTDGSCDMRKSGKSRISYSSTSLEMAKQVQYLLLNLGIVSSIVKNITKPNKKVKVSSVVYKIEINQPIAIKRFKEQIGFRIKRKQYKISYLLKKYQRQYIKRDNCEFCWKRIKKIENLENETFDFNIPNGHNFFSNGFISHNTPRGKNWFYEMWMRCKELGAAFHFTSLDGVQTSQEEWQRLKLSNPTSYFQQNYEAAFLEGADTVFRGVREIIRPDCLQETPQEPCVVGIDLAQVNDYTVLTVVGKNSHKVLFIDRFNRIPYPLQIKRIIGVIRKYGAKPIIDVNNIGLAICDELRANNINPVDFKICGTVSSDPLKKGSKDELIEKLTLDIEQKNILIPPNETLIDELESFAYNMTDAGRKRYSAPEGMHDDMVISLALANWGLMGKTKQEKVEIQRSMPKKRKTFQYR